jgi:hypothetical protein
LIKCHLVLWGGLGEEVVDAGLICDGAGGQRVVTGDHDRSDAHSAHFVEPLAHAGLDDVFEMDHPEGAGGFTVPLLGDHQRRTAGGANAVHDGTDTIGRPAAVFAHPGQNGGRRALAYPESAVCPPGRQVDSRHAGLGAERHPGGCRQLARLARPQSVPLLGQHHHGASLWSLISQAGQLRSISQLGLISVADREELTGLSVAERDGARLVQQQGVDVPGRLDRTA